MAKRIYQIIPADAWYAVYIYNETDVIYQRVVCWALADFDPGTQAVYGLDATLGLSFCEDSDYFDRYIHESELPKIAKEDPNA